MDVVMSFVVMVDLMSGLVIFVMFDILLEVVEVLLIRESGEIGCLLYCDWLWLVGKGCIIGLIRLVVGFGNMIVLLLLGFVDRGY